MRHRLLKVATVLCLSTTMTALAQQSDPFAPEPPVAPVAPVAPEPPVPPVLSNYPFIKDGRPVGQSVSRGES
ncbi:hypothetical protein N9260_00385 [bacterium]|nr:hypothetical protein [bacterium]